MCLLCGAQVAGHGHGTSSDHDSSSTTAGRTPWGAHLDHEYCASYIKHTIGGKFPRPPDDAAAGALSAGAIKIESKRGLLGPVAARLDVREGDPGAGGDRVGLLDHAAAGAPSAAAREPAPAAWRPPED